MPARVMLGTASEASGLVEGERLEGALAVIGKILLMWATAQRRFSEGL